MPMDISAILQLLLPLLQGGIGGQGSQGQSPQMPISAATGQPFPLLTTTPQPSTGVAKGGPGYYGPEGGVMTTGIDPSGSYGGPGPEQLYGTSEIAAAAKPQPTTSAFDSKKFATMLSGGGAGGLGGAKGFGGKSGQKQQSNPAYSAPIYESFLQYGRR